MEKEKSRKGFTKMTVIIIAMLVSLAALGMGTYAWYTLSTNPEIKGINASVNTDKAIQVSLDNENYSYSSSLNLGTYLPLVPVSTTDGLNWFVCKYDMKGDVLQEDEKINEETKSQYMYLRFPKGGNASASAVPAEGEEAAEYSFYVYKDIYLKTQEEETDVYLSLPSQTNYEQDEMEKNHYGTYVLTYAEEKEGSGNVTSVSLKNEMSETSVRVGFLVIGETKKDKDGEEILDEDENPVFGVPENERVTSNGSGDYPFFIFEPNADVRSFANKEDPSYRADKYIAGFVASGSKFDTGKTETDENEVEQPVLLSYSEADGYYFQTYPVGIDDDTKAYLQKLITEDDEDDDTDGITSVYTWDDIAEDLENEIEGKKTVWPNDSHAGTVTVDDTTKDIIVDGQEVIFPVDHLIVQGKSTWKDLVTVEKESEEETSEADESNSAAGSSEAGDTESSSEASSSEDESSSEASSSAAAESSASASSSEAAESSASDEETEAYTEDDKKKILSKQFDSTLLGSMGKFLDLSTISTIYSKETLTRTNADYNLLFMSPEIVKEARSSVKITTLKKDKPQKIRIYFWIEGQDVDCWNDVSHSNFLVNLEFVGDVK